MKKKVAFILPSFRGGGAEKITTTLINNLEGDYERQIYVLENYGPYKKKLQDDVEIIDLEEKRASRSFFKILNLIKREKPDIIFSTFSHLNVIVILAVLFSFSNTKIIIREPNTPSVKLNELSLWKKNILVRLIRVLYKKADVIISQCEEMKQDMCSVYNLDKMRITRIYNPLEIDNIREEIGFTSPYSTRDKINIVASGRLTRQKGFDSLIKAFSIVQNEIDNICLTILGEGELREELEELVHELNLKDKVILKGYVKNPYPYYHYSDLFVLSSRWEGFPNSLLEALACGTRVVSTRCKSGPNEILKNVSLARLVKVDDIEEMAFKIKEVLQLPKKFDENILQFDVEKVINEYKKMF